MALAVVEMDQNCSLMKPAHRKAHFWIWLALALALPAGFFLALREAPEAAMGKSAILPADEPLGRIFSTNADGLLSVHVRKGSPLQPMQLEVEVKNNLGCASALLLAGEREDRWPDSTLLEVGYLAGRGVWRFPLPEPLTGEKEWRIFLYDELRRELVCELML